MISAECEVVRTESQTGSGRNEFFRSGVRIVRADEQSATLLQSLFPA